MGNTHVSTLRGVATVAFMCGSMLHHQMFPDAHVSDSTLSGPQRHILGGGPSTMSTKPYELETPMKCNNAVTLDKQIHNGEEWAKLHDQAEPQMFITYTNRSKDKVTVKVLKNDSGFDGITAPVLKLWIDVQAGPRTFSITWPSGIYPTIKQKTGDDGPPLTYLQMHNHYEPSKTSPGVTYYFEFKGEVNQDLRNAAAVDPISSPKGSGSEEDQDAAGAKDEEDKPFL